MTIKLTPEGDLVRQMYMPLKRYNYTTLASAAELRAALDEAGIE